MVEDFSSQFSPFCLSAKDLSLFFQTSCTYVKINVVRQEEKKRERKILESFDETIFPRISILQNYQINVPHRIYIHISSTTFLLSNFSLFSSYLSSQSYFALRKILQYIYDDIPVWDESLHKNFKADFITNFMDFKLKRSR